MKLELKRFKETEKSTLGKLFIDGVFECYTLENPYLDNQNNISCIPTGYYHWKIRNEPQSKYPYPHIHITNVVDRSWILIHIGNYPKDTLGCILPGTSYGEDAVWNSKEAFEKVMSKVSNDGTIIITNEF
jgi:hypothetical protein